MVSNAEGINCWHTKTKPSSKHMLLIVRLKLTYSDDSIDDANLATVNDGQCLFSSLFRSLLDRSERRKSNGCHQSLLRYEDSTNLRLCFTQQGKHFIIYHLFRYSLTIIYHFVHYSLSIIYHPIRYSLNIIIYHPIHYSHNFQSS